VAYKFHFAILRIEVTRASRGLSAIAELLVLFEDSRPTCWTSLETVFELTALFEMPFLPAKLGANISITWLWFLPRDAVMLVRSWES